MFGGYARYRHYAMNQRWLQPVPACCPAPLRDADPQSGGDHAAAIRLRCAANCSTRSWAAAKIWNRCTSTISIPPSRAAEQRALFRNLPAASPYANFCAIGMRKPALHALAACCTRTRRPTWWSCS